MSAQSRNPAHGGVSGNGAGERQFHVDTASAEPLLQRLEMVKAYGAGWRARCPACGGKSQKLAITETAGKVLLHCFAGCRGDDVLEAVGLRWGDLYPPRYWAESKQEHAEIKRAWKQAAWGAALEVLATEAAVVTVAGGQLLRDGMITPDDFLRLQEAYKRVSGAASVLLEGQRHG